MGGLENFELIEMEEGVASSHPVLRLPLYVAPSTRDEDATKNTLRMSLDPIACWRLNDARFEFDSSFVVAEARKELRHLAKMIKTAPEAPLSIFGHADPVGDDAYNLVLAQRRARSIHAILTRDVDTWKDLYDHPHGGDDWKKLNAESAMLTAIGYSPSKADIETFQSDFGQNPDGVIGKDSRPVLMKRYMDWLCPVTLKKEAFLGGGKDKKGKGDYQSCGEFNPVFLLNAKEAKDPKDTKHAKRNQKNSVNRRVVVYFYNPGTVVEVPAWPCPAAPRTTGEATAAKATCKKRFWKDSDARLEPLKEPLPEADPGAAPPPDDEATTGKEKQSGNREFKERQRTMACRFYHRMAGWSPCEGGKPVTYWAVRVMDLDKDVESIDKPKPLANVPFVATVVGNASKRTVGSTNADGILRIRAHAPEKGTTSTQFEVHLQIDEKRTEKILLDAGLLVPLAGDDPPPADADRDKGVMQRLYNMAYTDVDPRVTPKFTVAMFAAAVRQFQRANGIDEPNWDPKTGISEATKKKLKEVYEHLDPGA